MPGGWLILVAGIGIAVNVASGLVLWRQRSDNLNMRAAILHLAGDALASLGVVVAGVLILATGWDRFDALVSLFVAALMLGASVTLLRESGRIFLEGAPASALPEDVGRAIASQQGVVETHDLHVWTVTSGFPALSAHVLVDPGADCHRIRLELETMLKERFDLEHTTLQVEHVGSATGLEIERSRV